MNYQSEVNFFGGLKSDGYMDMWRWLYLDTAHKLSGQFLTTDNSAPSHKSKPQLLNLNSISLSVSKTLPVHFFSPVWFAFPQKQTLLRTHIPHYWWEPPFKYIKEKTHTRSNNGSGSDREELGFNLELTEIEKTLSAKSAPTKVQKLQQKASRVWSSPIRLNTITSLIFWSKPNAMQWQHPISPFYHSCCFQHQVQYQLLISIKFIFWASMQILCWKQDANKMRNFHHKPSGYPTPAGQCPWTPHVLWDSCMDHHHPYDRPSTQWRSRLNWEQKLYVLWVLDDPALPVKLDAENISKHFHQINSVNHP